MTTPVLDLDNRFVALRFARGISQTDVIEGTGISRGTIYALERGGEPSAPTARKLADYYTLSVRQIMGADPIPELVEDDDPAIADGDRAA